MNRRDPNLRRSQPPARSCQRHAAPGGFTFLEIVAAAGLLAVLLSTASQLASQARRHARLTEHRAAALAIAENAMEQLTARPWEGITDATIAAWTLPAEALRDWPEARITGAVTEDAGPLQSKRVTLRVELAPQSPATSAALTTWIYRAPSAP
jgi:type II secretory pathway pseudopilin PulG